MSAKRRQIILFITMAMLVVIPETFGQAGTGKWDSVPMSNLKAGVAQADITPKVGIMLSGFSGRGPSTGLRDPLKVKAIVFDDGKSRAAILSFDLIMLLKPDGVSIKTAIRQATGIPGDHVILNASHNHAAPAMRNDPDYYKFVVETAARITKEAAANLRPASLGYGEGVIDFNINRRYIDEKGKSQPMLNPKGPIDRRIKILRIDAGDAVEPLAVIVLAVCHPSVFRHPNRLISGELTGIAMDFVERSFGNKTVAMFLQGATGDIRPAMYPVDEQPDLKTYRHGSEADLIWCSYSLGAEVIQVATALLVREKMLGRITEFKISAADEILKLPYDIQKKLMTERDELVDGKILYHIRALAIGKFLFVGLAGEPVVEYAFGIEKDLAPLGKTIFVLGYCDGDAGYVPVKHMIDEGGYEADRRPYGYDSEQQIRDGVKKLTGRMLQ